MAAGITVCAVIYLVGVEDLMYSICSLCNVSKEAVTLLVADVDYLADMLVICDDTSAGVALLLKENEPADIEVANLYTKLCKRFAADAIAAIGIFRCNSSCIEVVS